MKPVIQTENLKQNIGRLVVVVQETHWEGKLARAAVAKQQNNTSFPLMKCGTVDE